MEESKQLSLRWDNHAINLASEAECFFQDEAFLDCTLFAEGQCLQAHKLILSAASPYFATLLRTAPDKHPIVIFNDIKYEELKGIVSFIYNGCVSIPQNSMAAFMHAAQSLLVRGLTNATKQWTPEVTIEPCKKALSSKRKQTPSQQRLPTSGPSGDDALPPRHVPPPPYIPPPTDESYRLQEVAMSNYLTQSARRYCKPMTQNPNFVMSSWKLGPSNVEEKNGHRKSQDDSEVPPAHLFKKFRLEKPPPATEGPDKQVEVKQEIDEDDMELPLVEPKVEMTEEDQDCESGGDGDSREQYSPPREAPVPLLVCRTSLQEDSDGSWSGTPPDPSNSDQPGHDLPCNRCHKRYKSRYALNRHVLYECGKARKSFACDECGKKVTRQDTLQKHKLIHLVQHMKEKEDAD